MGTLAELWDAPSKASTGSTADVAPKKNPLSSYIPGTPIGEPQVNTLANLWDTVEVAPKSQEAKSQGLVASALQKAHELKQQVKGLAEPIAAMATGGQAAVIGPLTGIVADIRSGKFGTPEGTNIGREQAENYAQQTTYQPKTQIGQGIVGTIGKATQAVGPLPELIGFAPAVEPALQQAKTTTRSLLSELPTVRVENVPKTAAQEIAPAAKTVEETLAEQKAVKGTPAPTFKVPEEVPPMPQSPLAQPEIANRENALRKVGIERIRNSALENNPKEASSQFITSQASQEPYGHGMTEQINYEKSKLDEHFNNVEKQSGGHVVRYGTENQVADEIRVGKTIKESLDKGYKDWVKEGKRLYEDAAKVHGEKPVELSGAASYLKNDANFAYEAERSLKTGITNYLKSQNLLDKEGNVMPMTVKQAEGLRQYVNSKYNPASYGVSKDLKNLIDKEVFEQVGGQTYDNARKHWAKGKATYENPKAMGDLLADNGVNEKIRDERVMNTLYALPQKQFNHIMQTLRSDKQLGAVRQVQTSLVNEIRRAGQSAVNQPYNSIAAAKKASELSEKLRVAFADNPKLLQQVYDGIEAGNIIHIPAKYPGAAVQTHLLKNKFSEMAIQKGATTAGGALGATVGGVAGAGLGAVGGEAIGSKITEGMRAKRQVKQLGKEIKQIKLSDIGKE